MSLVQTEHVLVVPASLFHKLGHFQGFCADTQKYLNPLLLSDEVSYQPRDTMEQDPSFKQLIPYVIFQHVDENGGKHVFQYTRGKGQGESRLHAKLSIGIGGHISSADAAQDEADPYGEGMQRELAEEVKVDTAFDEQCVGLINDDETEVGKVHLGVVHVFTVAEPRVQANEEEIVDAGFRPLAELREELDRMETWSSICFNALFR
jgi:predicted NUDIX family phosphoesterase